MDGVAAPVHDIEKMFALAPRIRRTDEYTTDVRGMGNHQHPETSRVLLRTVSRPNDLRTEDRFMMPSSPNESSGRRSLRDWHGWRVLGVTAMLAVIIALCVVFFGGRGDSEPKSNESSKQTARLAPARVLPRPPVDLVPDVNVVPEQLDGLQVLRIRTHAEGDEMIVDAATGKLLAVRNHLGRMTPIDPMSGKPMTMKDTLSKDT
jgi:hypothetical protein